MMDRGELLELARTLLIQNIDTTIGYNDGNAVAMLSFAFSTGVELRDEEDRPWPLSGDDFNYGTNNFSDCLLALQLGLLEFVGTDFSQLVDLAKYDSAAYDACLYIATSNLERGLTPELAEMLRNHLQKPSRPRKGNRKLALRDEAIQISVYTVCQEGKISPTRNGRNNNSGCDIVQEAMASLPEYTRYGLPSYEGVRKIWDERRLLYRIQSKHTRRKN
ncbi:hypothetical protein [Pseudohongiella sp.]|uniref:Uncharacterized protein n=1 Tax=marine sediment metagenome TaxID=412755 RepID=A0A0F9YH30_9ZZZZ|nr:hypothetical protein [Pseudohongiella sp.]HDZ09200.1 hypothetical protein [Pseudohongiella sp.]